MSYERRSRNECKSSNTIKACTEEVQAHNKGVSTFQNVANLKDLKEGSLLRVDVQGKPIVLAMVQGRVYAMDAVCSREGGPLEDGIGGIRAKMFMAPCDI
jgi:hypothetical protein